MEKKFSKGDAVIMTNCGEAEHYKGRVWICRTDSYLEPYGRPKREVVFLEGFPGYFLADCLTLTTPTPTPKL